MPGPLLRYRPIWIANTPARWSDQKTMTDENQTKRTFHPELLGLFSLLSWTSRLYVFDNCLRLNYKCLHIRLFRMVISWLWSSILYCIPLENSNFIVQHHKTNNCYFEYLRKCLVTIIVVIKCANIVLRKQKLDQQVAQCTVFNWSCNNRAFKKKLSKHPSDRKFLNFSLLQCSLLQRRSSSCLFSPFYVNYHVM